MMASFLHLARAINYPNFWCNLHVLGVKFLNMKVVFKNRGTNITSYYILHTSNDLISWIKWMNKWNPNLYIFRNKFTLQFPKLLLVVEGSKGWSITKKFWLILCGIISWIKWMNIWKLWIMNRYVDSNLLTSRFHKYVYGTKI